MKAVDDLVLCSLFLSAGSFTSQLYNSKEVYKWNSFVFNCILNSLGEFILISQFQFCLCLHCILYLHKADSEQLNYCKLALTQKSSLSEVCDKGPRQARNLQHYVPH